MGFVRKVSFFLVLQLKDEEESWEVVEADSRKTPPLQTLRYAQGDS